MQKEGLRKVIWHQSILERKWRKNPFKKRENEKQAGGKYQELICRHSPKRSWEAMEGMKLVMEISIRGKHPKNAIFKKAAGNQAGVLWESTKLTSALTYSSHQLQSLSHPGNTPASRELPSGVTNLHITSRAHLKRKSPGTHFPQPQAGKQWLSALSMCKTRRTNFLELSKMMLKKIIPRCKNKGIRKQNKFNLKIIWIVGTNC